MPEWNYNSFSLCRRDESTMRRIRRVLHGQAQFNQRTASAFVSHGVECVSDHEAIVVNCPTRLYNDEQPDEMRAGLNGASIRCSWVGKDGRR